MSKTNVQIEVNDYKNILKEVRSVPILVNEWFPQEVCDWVEYTSTVLGVSSTYLTYPLCTAVAYCAQHATVTLEDGMHSEPVLLYSLVAGRSGTNKSASMKRIIDLILNIENPNGGHGFDTGTLEGLMKCMRENNKCVISANDEFANFYESLEKGSSSNFEKSRFLSLYSCTRWSKKNKSNGDYHMEDPRFNFVAFTQPFYAVNFAQTNVNDGFFQRFMVSIPPEVFIRRKNKKQMKKENSVKNRLDIQKVLDTIYQMGLKEHLLLTLDPNAEELYDEYHDSAVDYRETNLYEENRVSVMSKSVGLAMRLSGVICLLRTTISKVVDEDSVAEENAPQNEENGKLDEEPKKKNFITKNDFQMALNMTRYSVKPDDKFNSCQKKGKSSRSNGGTIKLPVPEPENFSIDYAIANQKIVKKYLITDSVPLSLVSRDKMYPIVQTKTGSDIANKFVRGLKILGLGTISPNSNAFKRYNPEDESCPDRENLRKKYKLLNMDAE